MNQSFVVECPECRGHFELEQLGVEVACPHCGLHLLIPAADGPTEPASASDPSPADAETASSRASTWSESLSAMAAEPPPLAPADPPPIADVPTETPVFEMTDADFSDADESHDSAPLAQEASPVSAFHATEPDPWPVEIPSATETATASSVNLTETTPSPTLPTEPAIAPHSEPEGDASFWNNLPTADDPPPNFFGDPAPDPAESDPWSLSAGKNSSPSPSPTAHDLSAVATPAVSLTDDHGSTDTLAAAASLAATTAIVAAPAIGGASSEEAEGDKLAIGSAHKGRRATPPAKETRRGGGFSLLTVILLSYASAATIAAGYLGFLLNQARNTNHALESLPDLEPPKAMGKKNENAKVQFRIRPEMAAPPGHTLKLGESQRFGSLRVTPVAVVREPLAFTYFRDDPKQKRPPTNKPVLKLKVRFENVSADQYFPPLDRHLVFHRDYDARDANAVWTNNFVCKTDEKTLTGQRVFVFDEPEGSSWDLADQRIEQFLGPGETLETYIPTTEDGLDDLTGSLVWRVHFRKGYHPTTLRGVTTLIDVVFDATEITSPS